MKLIDELEKVKKQEYDIIDGDKIVAEAKTLLLAAHDQDSEVLGKLNLDHHLQYERELKADVVRTAKAEEVYSSTSFTGKQIKKLANTYDLKCLPTQYYNGKIPADLAKIVAKFAEANNVEVNSSDFFILAPTEMFNNLKSVPVDDRDPILLYRDRKGKLTSYGSAKAEEGEVFVNIHNWGNDFTALRALRVLFNGYKSKESQTSTLQFTRTILIAFAISFILGLCGQFVLSLIPLAIGSLISYIVYSGDTFLTDDLWNVNTI